MIPTRLVGSEEIRVTQSWAQHMRINPVPVQLPGKVEVGQLRVVIVFVLAFHLWIVHELAQIVQVHFAPLMQHRRDDNHTTGILANVIGQQFGE